MIIFLMSIFNQNGNHIGSDQGFDLNMSRGDISSYLSISREEISRILQKLEISGLIFVKKSISEIDRSRGRIKKCSVLRTHFP